jgi:hypothetical protein
MKNMLRVMFLFMFFCVLQNKAFPQEDTCYLDYLQEFQIVNKKLYLFLDTTISKISNYDEFVIYNTDLFTIVTISDTNSLKVEITPCSYNQYNSIFINDSIRGFSFIKNHLVLLVFGQNSTANAFVKRTNKKDSIRIIQSDNIAYHIMPARYKYYFTIKNNEWIINDYTKIIEQSDVWIYIYRVKKGDTWEKLAKKFHGPESEIKFYPEEPLCVGMYIDIRIWINENKELQFERFF